ncbi:MAG: hypothetical protein RL196_533 [Actinomycetota bacterium]
MSSAKRWWQSIAGFRFPENLGSWVLSWKFWVGIAPARLFIMDQRFLANHEHYLIHLLPSLLLAYLVSGIPLYLTSITVLKNRFNSAPNILVSIVAWMLSDIAMSASAVFLLGPENLRSQRIASPVSMVIHALGTIPIGATLLFGVCLTFLAIDRANNLANSLAQQQLLLESADDYYVSIRQKFSDQIATSLKPGFERIKVEVAALAEKRVFRGKLLDFADRVREFTSSEVRQLSHLIAANEIEVRPLELKGVQSFYRQSLFAAGSLRPANAFLEAWIFVAFGLITRPDSAWWLLVIEGLVVWFAADISIRLNHIYFHAGIVSRWLIMAISFISPIIVASAVDAALNTRYQQSSIGVYAFVVVLCSLLLNYPYRYHLEVSANLEAAEVATSRLLNRIRTEASSIRDGFSRFIHSKIQGRLALVSFILGQIATDEIKGRERTKQVKRLTELLDTIEEELKGLSPQAPRQALPELAAQLEAEWAGLLEVLFEVEPAAMDVLSEDAALEHQVASLIEEALLNSRLHGKASEVSISVAKSAGADIRIKVTVIDNGVGLANDRTSGLGSSYFSAVCESWTITRIDSNTRFDALVQGAAT